MLATRSLLFNTLFYLNLVVLMVLGLPTMLPLQMQQLIRVPQTNKAMVMFPLVK